MSKRTLHIPVSITLAGTIEVPLGENEDHLALGRVSIGEMIDAHWESQMGDGDE